MYQNENYKLSIFFGLCTTSNVDIYFPKKNKKSLCKRFTFNNKLTSLRGAPQTVGGDFWCTGNQLINLIGAPHTVDGDFYCIQNQLTSLKGSPHTVGGDFGCGGDNLTNIDDMPKVINGFSELMAQVFGEENGVGARSAIGTNSLPGNIPVEIECIFELY